MGQAGAGRWTLIAAALAALCGSQSARASGAEAASPWYLDGFGGTGAERLRLYDGRLGIVMAPTPRAELLIAWRLLHGRAVGRAAGAALTTPCCDLSAAGRFGVAEGWLAARALVPGAPEPVNARGHFLPLERDGPNYTTIATCFPDALDRAAVTLRDRVRRYGAGSADVRAWLAQQDVVFASCSTSGAPMPPLAANAPQWLRADRAYQEAALALYDQRFDEAARRFAAIGADAGSPWRPWGRYLTARARWRQALADKSPGAYRAAHAALDTLAAAPPGTPGRGLLDGMAGALAFREHPAALKARLAAQLDAPALRPDAAVAFRDLYDLSPPAAEAVDWIWTLRLTSDRYLESGEGGIERRAGLTHAVERWRATADVAWLVAALTLVDPGEAEARALAADAGRVPLGAAAGLTARYHLVRLTLSVAPPARSRVLVDEALARRDLSPTERNLFLGERTMVAQDRAAFLRSALRTRPCVAVGCTRDDYSLWNYERGFRIDSAKRQGFGADTDAIIDRLPVAERTRIVDTPTLDPLLRRDIAVTTWARAVALQDDAAIDGLSRRLVRLMPVFGPQFARVTAARPGADKRFAEFFILAHDAGIAVDLPRYVRLDGKPSEMQRGWTDWPILPRGARIATSPPDPAAYVETQGGEFQTHEEGGSDLLCLGRCGGARSPLRLPDFAAALAPTAARERGAFVVRESAPDKPSPLPGGAVSAWEEMLTYARAHPADARVPEALHWLVRVGRGGGSHEHSGRRAFLLLHARYPRSVWAARTRYYYD